MEQTPEDLMNSEAAELFIREDKKDEPLFVFTPRFLIFLYLTFLRRFCKVRSQGLGFRQPLSACSAKSLSANFSANAQAAGLGQAGLYACRRPSADWVSFSFLSATCVLLNTIIAVQPPNRGCANHRAPGPQTRHSCDFSQSLQSWHGRY